MNIIDEEVSAEIEKMRKNKRHHIAIQCLAALISAGMGVKNDDGKQSSDAKDFAKSAIQYADALIEKLEESNV